MKYKRQLVSGMLAISLLTGGTTAFAAETEIRPSKVTSHVNQLKMRSDNLNASEFKSVSGKRIKNKDKSNKTKDSKKLKQVKDK